MSLSVQKRWEIVFLCRHKLGPKLGFKSAAKYVGCSPETARRWVLRYETTGDICDEEGRARKRKTNTDGDKAILRIAVKKKQRYPRNKLHKKCMSIQTLVPEQFIIG